jgi:hypothetical protein
MKRKKLKYIFLAMGVVLFSQILYGQSTAICTERINCSNGESWEQFTRESRSFPTKRECEQARQKVHNTTRNVSTSGKYTCVAHHTCGECSGSDPSEINPTTPFLHKEINLNGIGQVYNPTNNPLRDNQNWKDEEELRMYCGERINGNLIIPKVKNEEFNKTYSSLINNGLKNQNPEGTPVISTNKSNFKNTSTPYVHVPKSGYEYMKDIAAKAGLNFSDYFSEPGWNLDLRNATSEDLLKWNHNYSRFLNDLYKGDKFAEAALLMPKQLMDGAIDKAAEGVMQVAPSVAILIVSMSKNGLKELNGFINGQQIDLKRFGVNTFTDVKDHTLSIALSEAKGFFSENVVESTLSTIAQKVPVSDGYREVITEGIPFAEAAITIAREKLSETITDIIFHEAENEIKK